MDMTKIKEEIAKQMPALVGDELKSILEDYEKTKERLKTTLGLLDEANKEIKDQKEVIKELDYQCGEMDAERQIVIKEKEEYETKNKNLDLIIARHEIICAVQAQQDIKELVALAFRNPTLKHEHQRSNYIPGFTDKNGHWQGDRTESESTTTTTETD